MSYWVHFVFPFLFSCVLCVLVIIVSTSFCVTNVLLLAVILLMSLVGCVNFSWERFSMVTISTNWPLWDRLLIALQLRRQIRRFLIRLGSTLILTLPLCRPLLKSLLNSVRRLLTGKPGHCLLQCHQTPISIFSRFCVPFIVGSYFYTKLHQTFAFIHYSSFGSIGLHWMPNGSVKLSRIKINFVEELEILGASLIFPMSDNWQKRLTFSQ